MTIRETIKKGMINLKTNGIEEPNLKARLLMQFILNKPRQYLLIYDNQTLSLRQEVNYFKAIKKIISGVPLQHITHMQEFMKMNFYVDENVLIPRSDTEILVEEVINISKKINAKKILDLCTGSGAIAISLAKYIENSEITAVDISKKALEIARTNAKNNDVENQITFVESDLFKNLKEDKYDVIVSNPPYIPTKDIDELSEEVRLHDPVLALDGDTDGLKFYKAITKQSVNYLKENGYLCYEIGYNQAEDVRNIMEQCGYSGIKVIKDLAGLDRVVIGRLNNIN